MPASSLLPGSMYYCTFKQMWRSATSRSRDAVHPRVPFLKISTGWILRKVIAPFLTIQADANRINLKEGRRTVTRANRTRVTLTRAKKNEFSLKHPAYFAALRIKRVKALSSLRVIASFVINSNAATLPRVPHKFARTENFSCNSKDKILWTEPFNAGT